MNTKKSSCNYSDSRFRACLEAVIWAANARFWNLISAIFLPVALLWARK